MYAFAAVPYLLATFLLLPVFGFAISWVVRGMIDGSVTFGQGMLANGILVGILAVGIKAPHPAAPWVVAGVMVTLMAIFPYAETQLARADLRLINADQVDRAHAALSSRPDNVPAAFLLARTVYDHGFRGHGIAIAEGVLSSLSTNQDPLRFRSTRDLFRAEEMLLAKWKREAIDPRDFQPLSCPLCGYMNPPGPIQCGGCEKPYLLEAARRTETMEKVIGKLVVAWALIALALTGGAWAIIALPSPIRFLVFGGALVTVGLVLTVMFRPLRADGTSPTKPFT